MSVLCRAFQQKKRDGMGKPPKNLNIQPDGNTVPTDTETVLGLMQRLRDVFPRVTEDLVGEAIDALAENPDVSFEAKIVSLTALHKRLSMQINKLRSGPVIVAPELWRNRPEKSENPVAFIRRVYGDHLGRGLTKANLRNVDRPLYEALAVWLARHKAPIDFDLPTKRDQNDAVLSHLAPRDAATKRDGQRLRSATQYRSRKS